jgi:sugar phosphate isomerase/epimerase
MTMKYGYVFTYDGRKINSEFRFAKKYFDFIELTIKVRKNVSDIFGSKNYLNSVKVLGHLDWNINLSESNPEEIKKACYYASLLKKLGAKKITIHPSSNIKLDISTVIKNNINSLTSIMNYCKKNKIELLVENTTTVPFNKAKIIKKLLDEIPGLSLTLDVGHVIKTSKRELDDFFKLINRVGHIHLHDVTNYRDHLFFRSHVKLKKIIGKIKKHGYDKTISFECFSIYKNGKIIETSGIERRLLLLDHLNFLRSG